MKIEKFRFKVDSQLSFIMRNLLFNKTSGRLDRTKRLNEYAHRQIKYAFNN